MYSKFQRHLKFYDRDRICQCRACSTASEFSLKIVYYYGDSLMQKVGHFEKLYGSDVTLVHKLLKNDIPLQDYLLLTTVPEILNIAPDWLHLKKLSSKYNGTGEVTFSYTPNAIKIQNRTTHLAHKISPIW